MYSVFVVFVYIFFLNVSNGILFDGSNCIGLFNFKYLINIYWYGLI